MKTKILQYSITFLVGAVLTVILLLTKGVFNGGVETNVLMKYFVDSFFVSGVLLLSAGALVVISDGGAFDFIIYGFKRFFTLFKKDPTKVKYRTYYDYVEAKRDEPKHSFWFLIIVGLLFFVVSMVFLVFWYQSK